MLNASVGEDYALARVPLTARRPLRAVIQVTLAIPSALVFLATGGELWRAYGTGPLVIGVVCGIVMIGYAGYVLTGFACRSGLDSDLMSIWAGYGPRGSAISSFIYSSNFVMLFALEDGIVASAVRTRYPALPQAAVLIGFGLVILMLTWSGVGRLSRVMSLTLPLLMLLLAWVVVQASGYSSQGRFLAFSPISSVSGVPSLLAVLAAILAFGVNAPVAADLGRFVRSGDRSRGALLMGVGLQVICFAGVIMLGAWLTFRLGGKTNPGAYMVGLAGAGGLVCVLVSQSRINMINAYAGSLSLSNFGLRSVGLRPGRQVWMVGVVAAATGLAMANLYASLLEVLRFDAVFVAGWTSTLVTYILLAPRTRKLIAETQSLVDMSGDHRSAWSLVTALTFAVPLTFGVAGELGKVLAPLVSVSVAAVGVAVACLRSSS